MFSLNYMKGGFLITKKTYTLYHLHSDYSLLDSVTDFKEYADMVKEAGGTAIASTEHGLPRGWVSKKQYCDSIGLKFIHGVEIYLTESLEPKQRDNYHTVLLAKNEDGVKELNRLVSISSDEAHFYYVNRISFDEFLETSDNIISTSACLASPLWQLDKDSQYIEKLAKKYTFLEVQPHIYDEQAQMNKRILALAQKYQKPIILGTDTHSSTPYKAECRKILLAAKNKSYGNEDSFDLSYKTYDELAAMLEKQGVLTSEQMTEALENTNKLADMCENFTLDTSIKYPILNGSAKADEEIFEKRCWDGLEDKLQNGIIPKEQEKGFRDALNEELSVFKKLQMAGFMLSMSDLVRWCKENAITVGTARGSVGGSRAAYVTDIIDLNPETWHTVFSRFCNENRTEVGDIDTDVIYEDRPKIFNYIVNRFGQDKTARVAAYGTLADKSVVVEICRALANTKDKEKYSIKNSNKIKEEFASDPQAAREKYPEVFYYYDGLVGCKVSQSIHPAGMVISPIDLNENYGTFNKDGERCLLLDMDEAHAVGAVKYDFLALKTLKVLRDTCNFVGCAYPKSNEINWNDEKVWEDMRKNQTTIFQFESPFAAECFRKFKTNSIADMSLVTACIRPSGQSYRDDVMAHKVHHNSSPIIDELLKDNYGYLVYQEDIIKFLQDICGLSGSDADSVRRAIGHKDEEAIAKALPRILEGYCEKSDKPHELAEQEAKEYLQVIEDSSSYSFNYSHSVAYCLLGYYCGYFRYYHPLEYITAFLNNAQNDEDIQSGAALAKYKGIQITSPKWGISKGEYFYDKRNNSIAKGLSSIKYLGNKVADELYNLSQNKNYNYFVDLLADLENTGLDSRQLNILIKIDFFSQFGNQRELFKIDDIFSQFKRGTAKKISKENVDGTLLEDVVKKYAVGTTKSGAQAKSYTLLDIMSIMHGAETLIKNAGIEDLSDMLKAQNYYAATGEMGYVTGKEEDRRKLFVKDITPVCRKSDGKQFGYSVYTKSIGSGKESRFTLLTPRYNLCPIFAHQVILCQSFERNGQYYKLTDYQILN